MVLCALFDAPFWFGNEVLDAIHVPFDINAITLSFQRTYLNYVSKLYICSFENQRNGTFRDMALTHTLSRDL